MQNIEIVQTKLGKIMTVTVLDTKFYRSKDVAACIEYSKTTLFNRFAKCFGDLELLEIATRGGKRLTGFINHETLKAVLKSTNKHKASELAEELNIQYDVIKVQRAEESTLGFLMQCFAGEKMKREYRVGPYRVDLYFKTYNIVVECDENDHKKYDQQVEKIRTDYITEQINPYWIRYNPDESMSHVVNRIFVTIRILDGL
jgi:very-short-patch-repair endonuclease